MRYRHLRQLIRLYLESSQKKKDDLLVEPEEVEGEEQKEFSAGGVAGAPAVSRRRNSNKK
tara:strand:+ start:970 stop:1149 length:180 start_codon:yes stop_codon:yes gene_type:complete